MGKIMSKVGEWYGKFAVNAVHFALIINGGTYLLNENFGNPVYHLSGALAGAIGRTIDILSTLKCIRQKERCSDKMRQQLTCEGFYETNALVGKDPSSGQFLKRALPFDTLLVAASALNPPTGLAFLTRDVIVGYHNCEFAQALRERICELEAENQ